ncbi:PREDICTED: uncharacterized protein LOC105526988 [Colobus angolensis palliatus]|uniref:uncharacterized protein LOC105526988 n=1 Tax=Colobus angolensis palliatus TaxID=336983 RepID=UPI0005F39CF9|nr:PREDICTED: uncharacterized protein LOC105526988 [Colobus angolensis palliatus]
MTIAIVTAFVVTLSETKRLKRVRGGVLGSSPVTLKNRFNLYLCSHPRDYRWSLQSPWTGHAGAGPSSVVSLRHPGIPTELAYFRQPGPTPLAPLVSSSWPLGISTRRQDGDSHGDPGLLLKEPSALSLNPGPPDAPRLPGSPPHPEDSRATSKEPGPSPVSPGCPRHLLGLQLVPGGGDVWRHEAIYLHPWDTTAPERWQCQWFHAAAPHPAYRQWHLPSSRYHQL